MVYESWASSPAKRAIMLANKRTDTKPELALRSELHRRGLRFRKDYRLDLGTVKPRPDVVFTRAKVAVFVDGCFWHSCPNHREKTPKTNIDYWVPKLAQNVERDRKHDAALREAGWAVVRVWEHVDVAEAADLVASALGAPLSPGASSQQATQH